MSINGFFLIDKPIGITSFDVLRKLRKILNQKKMGHTGTLDPLATGALLVAVGNYTKLIPYFEKDIKEYVFQVALDGVTDSFDAETEVHYISEKQQSHFRDQLKIEDIDKILQERFSGEIEQVPPKYSAIKMGGRKALDMVRAGKEFEMKIRKVTIYEIEVLEFSYPYVTLRASVSAGTYIRSIAKDLGDIIGSGAYIKELRRTKIGSLDIGVSQGLENFDMTKTLNEEILFGKERFIELSDDIITKLNHGLTVRGDFDYEDNTDYFLRNKTGITNIITCEKPLLKPKKRIL
ncbi:tRNA pseudouridine(55) synthase TruB [Candidatus Gracilibacteria bacterium 28_42_T64]|nr:tRNA pseudouridine(55) synthase TruB [Candidatus Gracilibacteria bacterium 28_42_T64]